jgi:hypothetical protein
MYKSLKVVKKSLITIVFSKEMGHVQVLKSRNKETEFFNLWNYFLDIVVARQTLNAG